MKIAALIPARLHSTRLPKKLIQDLGGLSVIGRTYQAVKNTKLFDHVSVITDSEAIAKEVQRAGGDVFMSKSEHKTGSDRIAEAAKYLTYDAIINVQGDEPFIDGELLKMLAEAIQEEDAEVVTAAFPISTAEDLYNTNNVKVYFNKQGLAENFSRYPMTNTSHHQHIGVYAFKKPILERFTQLPMSEREREFNLENLRFLDNGIKVRILVVDTPSIGIDTQEDLDKARQLWNQTNSTDN